MNSLFKIQILYLLRESFFTLRSNPLRSFLSIIGVVCGVASVVTMLCIGLGAEKEIDKMLSALGTQNVHITNRDLSPDDWLKVLPLSQGLGSRDVLSIQNAYPQYPISVVARWPVSDFSRASKDPKIDVFGVSARFFSNLDQSLLAGRFFTEFEDAIGEPLLLLGERRAREWFSDPQRALGELVRMDGSWFRVLGVIKNPLGSSESSGGGASSKSGLVQENSSLKNQISDSGSPNKPRRPQGAPETGDTAAQYSAQSSPSVSGTGVLQIADAVILPINAARLRLGPFAAVAPLDRVIIKVTDKTDPTEVGKNVQLLMSKIHRESNVIQVVSADEMIKNKRQTTRLFTTFLLVVALISLLVGGIGIANVMLAGMVERIREIGLRRAIGAKKRDILVQFLVESVIVCLVGGALGSLLGAGSAWIAAHAMGWTVVYPLWVFLVAIVVASCVGFLSGLFPARKASAVSPIEALQGRL